MFFQRGKEGQFEDVRSVDLVVWVTPGHIVLLYLATSPVLVNSGRPLAPATLVQMRPSRTGKTPGKHPKNWIPALPAQRNTSGHRTIPTKNP